MRPDEAVVVGRIEPRKGDAGKIFREFKKLEYFEDIKYIIDNIE